jgi:hypothetical protein
MTVDVSPTVRVFNLIGSWSENFYALGRKDANEWEKLASVLTSKAPVNPIAKLTSNFLEKKFSFNIPQKEKSLDGLFNWKNTFLRDCWQAYIEGVGLKPDIYLELIDTHYHHPSWGQSFDLLRYHSLDQNFILQCFRSFPGFFPHYINCYSAFHPEDPTRQIYWITQGLCPFFPFYFETSHRLKGCIHSKLMSLRESSADPLFKICYDVFWSSQTVSDIKKKLRTTSSSHAWGYSLIDQTGDWFFGEHFDKKIETLTSPFRDDHLSLHSTLPLKPDTKYQLPLSLAHLKIRKNAEFLKRHQQSQHLSNLSLIEPLTSLLFPDHGYFVSLSSLSKNSSLTLMINSNENRLEQELSFSTPPTQPNTSKKNQSSTPLPPVETHLLKAQAFSDWGQLAEAFHHLQMALSLMDEDKKNSFLWIWFFWQWQVDQNARDLKFLYNDCKKSLLQTPLLYRPHLELLIMLLEKELKLEATVKTEFFPLLLRKIETDSQICRSRAEWSRLKRKIQIRLDAQDICYRE